MNADPSVQPPLELEPEAPPPELDDDHDFDDDLEPSWWSISRPRPNASLPRPRTEDDEATATEHVARVRARLTPDEQRAFDDLMRGPAATDIVTMLVNRGEDDAVAKLRRRLADEPVVEE